jgi:hypothetical protein
MLLVSTIYAIEKCRARQRRREVVAVVVVYMMMHLLKADCANVATILRYATLVHVFN